jgi:hypothetical protein
VRTFPRSADGETFLTTLPDAVLFRHVARSNAQGPHRMRIGVTSVHRQGHLEAAQVTHDGVPGLHFLQPVLVWHLFPLLCEANPP